MNLALPLSHTLVSKTLCLGLLLQAVASDNPIGDVVQDLRSRNYTAAIARADAGLKAHPEDPRLLTLKGMAIAASDPAHPSAALPSFRHALKISPSYLPALEGAAQVEYTLGDSAAREHLERILAMQPAEPAANGMLAVLDFRAANYAEAAKHFHLAEPLIGDQPQALAQYAASLANSGQIEAALPIFEKLVQLQPNDAGAAYNLALAEFRLKRFKDAVLHLEPLLASPQPSEDVLTLAAEIYESQGQTQQSLDLLRKATLLYPKSADAYIYMAHVAFAHSSVQVGVDVLNVGIRNLPNDSRLYVARGILLAQMGKNDQALADFDQASKLDPKLSMTNTARGIAQSQQHHDDVALSTFRNAAHAHPDDALAQYLLAEALSNKNPDPDSAEGKEELDAALRASRLDPGMVAAHDLVATVYLRQEKYAEAAAASEAALAVDPKDQQALYHLVLTARKGIHKDQLPKLIQRLSEARDAGPDPMESPRGFLTESGSPAH